MSATPASKSIEGMDDYIASIGAGSALQTNERNFNEMILIFSVVGAWLFLGWKVGLALAFGIALEGVEAVVLLRAVSRLRREKADLVNLLHGVAGDLERAVQEVDSRLGIDSQMAREGQI
jgi:hypothetical protein